MKVETFDLIQQRHAELRVETYTDRYPSIDDPSVLHDPSRRKEPLYGWSSRLYRLLEPSYYPVKLPEEAEWYNAMYTNPNSRLELQASSTQKLAAFVLRNKPFDMGEPVRTRLVISGTGEADESLLTNYPLLTVWAGPAGPFAGESPLLRDASDPDKWQSIVAEIFDELDNSHFIEH